MTLTRPFRVPDGCPLPALAPCLLAQRPRRPRAVCPGLSPSLMNAITSHITACLDNISPLAISDDLPEAEVKVFPRLPRLRPGHILPGW